MKEVKDKVDQLAKRNKGVNADQVREALRLCEELQDAGIAPQRGVGYRLSTPFSSARSTRRTSRKSKQPNCS